MQRDPEYVTQVTPVQRELTGGSVSLGDDRGKTLLTPHLCNINAVASVTPVGYLRDSTLVPGPRPAAGLLLGRLVVDSFQATARSEVLLGPRSKEP